MRDTIVILSVIAASIILGAGLYFFGPEQFRIIPATSQPASVTQVPEARTGPVEFFIVDEGSYAADVTERTNYVVNGDEHFDRLWNMVHGDVPPPMPAIDFMTYDVIAVFAGEQPTGGYTAAVTGVEDTEDERIVHITITAPGEGCMTTQAITSPYQIVRVPLSGLPLSKEYTETTEPCE